MRINVEYGGYRCDFLLLTYGVGLGILLDLAADLAIVSGY